jgi:hydrogenase maturation protein HypF
MDGGERHDVGGRIGAVIPLPRPVPAVLAVGAFLKNTLCLADADRALVSVDVGNLETVEAVRAFEATAEHLLARAARAPSVVAHDLHPDFHSSRHALALAARLGAEALAVQHHHAHVAAVMAEHGIDRPVLGLALDGFGLGPGSQSWGGELLRVDRDGYDRLGHLALLPQPGGDRAAREPWRMAAAALFVLGRGAEIGARFARHPGAEVVAQMLERGVNCPPTSSCGRLFDAACGLLGVIPVARFEGEAPMALEALVDRPRVDPAGWRIVDGVLDPAPLLERLIGRPAAEGAAVFHGTLAAALADWAARAAEATGIRRLVLGGGCFLNKVLTEALIADLDQWRIEVLRPVRLGPGDQAISLGQAWAAAMARE